MNSPEQAINLDYFFRPEFFNIPGEDISKRRAVSAQYQWLSAISSQPENVRLFIFQGPSMAPTLFDGDLLMVDLGQITVYSGCLYLVKIDGAYLVNRLVAKPSSHLSIVRDNQEMCPPFDLPQAQVTIAGRIIWTSRFL